LGFFLAFVGCRAASAQCYEFSSGSAASLSLDIANLPAPTVNTANGTTTYMYTLSNVAGNTSSLTIGSTTYSAAPPVGFATV
jgi:hypothetical protein